MSRLFEDLRHLRVAVIHPPGEDRDILQGQLKRIGCQVRWIWPFCATRPADTDVIFFLVDREQTVTAEWCCTETDAALIALIDYENPTVLSALLETNASAVITKPFRSFGILSSLVLARSSNDYKKRLNNKVKRLEDTLRSRREIEKAIGILVARKSITASEAYEAIRKQATSQRIPVVQVATDLIRANEAFDKMGLLSGDKKI
ncbi:ANTAR domain-containing protein [Herbaspirillum lusitanum]|uniref:ANTAR domain-containing protein n=1 Tax=Herbaspirillum rhizosphaerae TaxID=346179 RepID=A0ABW8Z644_9BURK|nr:ANTAR domain-containing protein [Herbaspirillum lusitanum]MCW5300369.1 ANTAR domain-containing protein [Herbaspirillum lusitanum]